MILELALAAFGGFVFTEVAGYWLHILLHSEKVAWLSRGHMIHHLKVYGPRRSLRQPGPYKNSVEGGERYGFLGVGLEWVLPIVLLIAATVALCSLILSVPALSQAAFLGAALLWGHLMFGAMHDSMHIEGHWLASLPLAGGWYRRIRRLHDIHHLRFSDDGRLLTNYGICFFACDRLFGTYEDKAAAFNEAGYQAALRRYAGLIR